MVTFFSAARLTRDLLESLFRAVFPKAGRESYTQWEDRQW